MVKSISCGGVLEGVSINSDFLNAFDTSYQTNYFTFEMVILFDDHMKPAIYYEEEKLNL